MESTIRNITILDTDEVLEMMREFYSSPAVFTDGSDEIFISDIENCINNSDHLEGYIIENSEAIQGYAMIAKSFSTEFGKPCIWIEDLYIRQEHRGKGLGKMFLDFITEKYTGCIFRLEVEEENAGAVRLYEKCGFDFLPYLEMKK